VVYCLTLLDDDSPDLFALGSSLASMPEFVICMPWKPEFVPRVTPSETCNGKLSAILYHFILMDCLVVLLVGPLLLNFNHELNYSWNCFAAVSVGNGILWL